MEGRNIIQLEEAEGLRLQVIHLKIEQANKVVQELRQVQSFVLAQLKDKYNMEQGPYDIDFDKFVLTKRELNEVTG